MTTDINEKQVKEKENTAVPSSENLTEELTAVLEDIMEENAPVEKKKGEHVQVLEDNQVLIGDRQYKLVTNYREGFDPEKLGERFSDVLSRYDFLVGDWGYEQLRLKGFFGNDNRRAFPDQRIDSLQDYLYEYCNFGCAYFVLERIGGKRERKQNRRRRNPKKTTATAYTDEKKAPVQSVKKMKPTIKNRKPEVKKTVKPQADATSPMNDNTKNKGGFVIRKREE